MQRPALVSMQSKLGGRLTSAGDARNSLLSLKDPSLRNRMDDFEQGAMMVDETANGAAASALG